MTLNTNLPFHIYINRTNNRLVYNIKDEYKLQTPYPELLRLFSSTKKLIRKTKNGKNLSSLKVFKVVLVQYNLEDNQQKQKSEVLYAFRPNKSYAYLLHVEPVNLVLLKTYNTQSNNIIITFKDQNGTPLELQEKVNLTSLTNVYNHLFRTSMNEFLSFARNLSKKYGKKFCYRKRNTCCKNYFQIKFHKTAEATGKKSLKIL